MKLPGMNGQNTTLTYGSGLLNVETALLMPLLARYSNLPLKIEAVAGSPAQSRLCYLPAKPMCSSPIVAATSGLAGLGNTVNDTNGLPIYYWARPGT